MQDLVLKICELKPSYREELAALKIEPEFSLIRGESQSLLKKALEKGKFDTRTEMFMTKGS